MRITICESQYAELTLRNILMNYFPTYIAQGQAFCNRKAELKRIEYNLNNKNPTLIISPRRYGKTSLVLKALEKFRHPFVHIDLYKAMSEEDIEKFILKGIGKLLGQLETVPKKLISLAGEFFSKLQVRVVLEKAGLELDFTNKKESSVDTILMALEKLQELAFKKKVNVVLFLDEFQIVGEVAKNYAIEAVLREMAQKSSSVSFIFSGSNRHIMEQIFFDKKRPFYKLCDLITLQRIHSEDYISYIQHAAKKRWNNILSTELILKILEISRRHPYYVNKLCSLIWQDDFPSLNKIELKWEEYVLENKAIIERELALLSLNQRKLLMILSRSPKNEIFSQSFIQNYGMSSSSISRSLKFLIEYDYVYLDSEKKYCAMDPLIERILQD